MLHDPAEVIAQVTAVKNISLSPKIYGSHLRSRGIGSGPRVCKAEFTTSKNHTVPSAHAGRVQNATSENNPHPFAHAC